MNLVLALCVGVLFACGVYLLLRRSALRVVLGLALLSHAANLMIFAAGRPARAEGRVAAPLVEPGSLAPPEPHADPLPQALVLTAIVISFGVLAFVIAMVSRAAEGGRDDTDTHRELDA